MSKVAVVFWSATGNTETMANCVAEGANGTIVPCGEMNAAKLAEFDAVAFGCPAMGAEQLEESEFEPMFSDLEGSLNGKKIATNTTNAFIPWYEENGAEVVGIDTSAEAIDLVLSGRADFLGISVPVLNAYLDEHPDAADKLKAAFVIPNSEDVIAIPVRKGEPEFLDAINAALAELREEGTLKEISEKYLGGDYTNSAYSN